MAGLGTRFLPATKASAKEMMPIVDKPLIQYAVEEAVSAGIDSIIFITGKSKRAIEDHFDSNPELERQLEEGSKTETLEAVRKILPAHVNCIYLRQAHALGLGHAILCAAPVIDNEPFAVLLADDFIHNGNGGGNCVANLIKAYEEHACSVVAVEEVSAEDAKKYGILSGDPIEEGLWRVNSLVEKPKAQGVQGNLAIIGRYVLNPSVLKLLRTTVKGVGNEIQLTDALVKEMEHDGLIAQLSCSKRYDCGDKLGYLMANVEMAMCNPHIGPAFRDYLSKLKF